MKKKDLELLNAGYTPIVALANDKKIGIYGMKAKLFSIIVFLLLFIVLVNLAVSI